ncbi:hypothetical protein IT400_04390 [Candidatus Nomurabacteria bacterium]|nr:hypothetical protein [Candidatus Nomurabacteria bacterium]
MDKNFNKIEQNINKEILPPTLLSAHEKQIMSKVLKFNSDNPKEWLDEFSKILVRNKTEHRLKIADFISTLNVDNIKDKKEFSKFIAKQLYDFENKNFTTAEIEEFSRQSHKADGNIEINRLATYHIENDGKSLSLHSPITTISNQTEMKMLVKDALQKLADKLLNDKNLSNIQTITGESWMVFHHRKFFEEFGFEIKSVDEEAKEAFMVISKEKLLALYGNNLNK